MTAQPKPGTRIRFTARFMRNTGMQYRNVWTTVKCSCGLCTRGAFVAVDETSYTGDGPRHIAIANVEEVTK